MDNLWFLSRSFSGVESERRLESAMDCQRRIEGARESAMQASKGF